MRDLDHGNPAATTAAPKPERISRFAWAHRLPYAKCAVGLLFVVLFASAISSMSRWNELRGVYDDICYLRQAHLFKRFGIGGFNTDISLDDDGFFSRMEKALGYSGWDDPRLALCHSPIPKTGKRVIQYPPGTGFMLALFPEGVQARGLYISVSALLLLISLLAIRSARTAPLIALIGAMEARRSTSW